MSFVNGDKWIDLSEVTVYIWDTGFACTYASCDRSCEYTSC